jgi:hypothetical protein
VSCTCNFTGVCSFCRACHSLRKLRDVLSALQRVQHEVASLRYFVNVFAASYEHEPTAVEREYLQSLRKLV